MKKDEKVILESILKDCGCAKEIIASCLQIKENMANRKFYLFCSKNDTGFCKNSWRTTKLDILDYVIFKLKQGGLKDV